MAEGVSCLAAWHQ